MSSSGPHEDATTLTPAVVAARRRRTSPARPVRAASLLPTAPVGVLLFLALFAAQAGVIALSPVLAPVAADFGVSTATAGQLRTASGLAAGVTALVVARAAARLGLRRLLLGGSALLAAASLASAAAPTFHVLLVAQVAIGVAIAVVVAAGTAAAAEWVPAEQRARVLSQALIGQPAAWIVGMPLIGALGEVSWRYGWLALPLVGALASVLVLVRAPAADGAPTASTPLFSALADPRIARWALSEWLANAGWAGTLVYAGALFTESHDSSLTATGLILAVAAAAYVAGNIAFRGRAGGDVRRRLVVLSLLLAPLVLVFGAVRPSPWVSLALLSAAAFVAGARTLVGYAVGLEAAPELRLTLMGARAAATQFGYFAGAAAAGVGLSLGGYAGLGAVLGALFVGAALALVQPRRLLAQQRKDREHAPVVVLRLG